MSIEAIINSIDDTDTLEGIIQLVKQRLEEIEKEKGVNIILYNGHWYAVQHLNYPQKRRAIDLGKHLSAKDVWERSQAKPPSALDYKIPEKQAKELRKTNPEEVGWVEEDTENGAKPDCHYYLVPDYNRVRSSWHKWQKLASHPLAMSYGLTVEGMAEVLKLQDMGYHLIFPNE